MEQGLNRKTRMFQAISSVGSGVNSTRESGEGKGKLYVELLKGV